MSCSATLPRLRDGVGRGWRGPCCCLFRWRAQAAWFFPTEIATRIPELRPLLVQFCAWSQCNVQLPRLPEQLFIEASDLQMLDPAHPSEVLLTATIRNRAPTSQDFPMLELTLTDASNQTAARKVFSAADYLDTWSGRASRDRCEPGNIDPGLSGYR